MTPRKVTVGIVLGVVVLLIAWDLVVATNAVDGDTISEVVAGWSWRWSTVPYGVGVVAGHLFWPRFSYITPKMHKRNIIALWALSVGVLLADVLGPGTLMPIWPFCYGVFMGRFFWAQRARRRESDLQLP